MLNINNNILLCQSQLPTEDFSGGAKNTNLSSSLYADYFYSYYFDTFIE